MTDPAETQDHERVLSGLLRCASCERTMLKIGVNYRCPTQVVDSQGACPTPPINAYQLLQLTIGHIIDRTINEQTKEQLTGIIQDEYAEKTHRSQNNLDQAEEAIAALNTLKNQTIHTVEHQDKPYSDVADEIERINKNTIALSYEARKSRREIDGYNFVSDPDRIKASALDLETYLGSASPENTRELLDMFVRSIEAGEDLIIINFTDNVPGTGQPGQDLSDRIPLR